MNKNLNYDDEMEIDLAALFHVLLRKWWLIAICAFMGGVIALGITAGLMTPKYQSNAMLYILNKTTSVTSLADIQIGTELTADFEVIAESKPVIDAAIERIKEEEGKTFTRKDLLEMLQISNKSGTRILTISAISANPQDACIVANAVANETAERMADIMKADPPTTVEPAEVAEKPVSPSMRKNTAMGFLAGIVLVCGVLVIRFILNDNIQTEEDVERYLGLSTLATIPYVKNREKEGAEKKSTLKKRKKEAVREK
jgi:capsular polysaccharide biosynthesis protein